MIGPTQPVSPPLSSSRPPSPTAWSRKVIPTPPPEKYEPEIVYAPPPPAPFLVVPSVATVGAAVNAAVVQPAMVAASGVMHVGLRVRGFSPYDVHTPEGVVRVWDALGDNPTGPAYVLLHGLATNAGEMGSTLTELKKTGRRVTCIDVPGHGGSFSLGAQKDIHGQPENACIERMVQATNMALDAAIQEPVVLIGHSLGGYLACRYQLEGANRGWVDKAILVSPDGGPWPADLRRRTQKMMQVETRKDASDLAHRIMTVRRFRATVLVPFIRARFSNPQVRYLVHSDAFQPVLRPEQLRGLNKNTLLVFGTLEALDPPEDLTYFDTYLPPGHQVARPETGHGDLSLPDARLMKLIADFSAGDSGAA